MVYSGAIGPRIYYPWTHLFSSQAYEPFRGNDNVLCILSLLNVLYIKKSIKYTFLECLLNIKIKKNNVKIRDFLKVTQLVLISGFTQVLLEKKAPWRKLFQMTYLHEGLFWHKIMKFT